MRGCLQIANYTHYQQDMLTSLPKFICTTVLKGLNPGVSRWFFFFLRMISHKLTTASPPLFAEEAWPWANVHAHLPLLYTWEAYHTMVCQVVPCPHPGSELANPGPLRTGRANLTAVPPGRPLKVILSSLQSSPGLCPMEQKQDKCL